MEGRRSEGEGRRGVWEGWGIEEQWEIDEGAEGPAD